MSRIHLLIVILMTQWGCAGGTFQDPMEGDLLDGSADRIVPKSFREPNIAFGDGVYTVGDGSADLLEPAGLDRSVDGIIGNFGVHTLTLREGTTVRLNGWTSHWAAYYVYGPTGIDGRRTLVASRQMSNPLKIGLETRYFDFEAQMSGDYLLVIGPVEGDEIDYVMLPQCVSGPCSTSNQ